MIRLTENDIRKMVRMAVNEAIKEQWELGSVDHIANNAALYVANNLGSNEYNAICDMLLRKMKMLGNLDVDRLADSAMIRRLCLDPRMSDDGAYRNLSNEDKAYVRRHVAETLITNVKGRYEHEKRHGK